MLRYSLLMLVVTNELLLKYPELQPGNITAILSHAHIYEAHYDIARNLIANAREMGKSYVIQDLDLNNCSMLWRLQTVSNIIADPNTAMRIFKDCIYSQFDGKQEFPPMYNPEIIK